MLKYRSPQRSFLDTEQLDDYIRDPRSFDNRGFLGQGRDEAVIAGRICTIVSWHSSILKATLLKVTC